MTARPLLLALVALAPPALAAPATVVHSGRLLDADGAPIEGQRELRFELVDGADAVRWFEPHTVTVEAGYYAVQLGTITPIPAGILGESLDVVVRVGGDVLGRQPLSAVPRALAVDGLVRVSAEPLTCAGNAGTLRWNTNELQVCDGTNWRNVSSLAPLTATGGTISTEGAYTVHTFTSSGATATYSFVVGPSGGEVEVTALGGGDGGGTGNGDWASGGGGGGYVKARVAVNANQTYTVTVGGRGLGQTTCNNALAGTAGATSSFGTLVTASGGGAGAQAGEVGAGGGYTAPGALALVGFGNGAAGNAATGDYNNNGGTNGGGATFGAGAAGVANYTAGTHASGNGNGGGGGPSCQLGHRGGGNGSPGIVIVRYPGG